MHQLSYVREASPGLPIFTYNLRNKQLNFTLLKNQDFIFFSDFFYFIYPEKLVVSIWLKTRSAFSTQFGLKSCIHHQIVI